jgi:hypothetical protein
MQRFTEQNELIRFAKDFVATRIEALENDVAHCLIEPCAPFPAIVLCFATIDLLGALYSGNASKEASTTKQSTDYMKHFMGYSEEQNRLLMNIFRHKIVHLAQPKPVIEDGKKKVAWRYWHDKSEQHLKLTKLKEQFRLQLTSSWEIAADHKFEISITHLVKDIAASVRNQNGYLHILTTDTDLQEKFKKAILEIYDYKK